jgi:hypothetical protein
MHLSVSIAVDSSQASIVKLLGEFVKIKACHTLGKTAPGKGSDYNRLALPVQDKAFDNALPKGVRKLGRFHRDAIVKEVNRKLFGRFSAAAQMNSAKRCGRAVC